MRAPHALASFFLALPACAAAFPTSDLPAPGPEARCARACQTRARSCSISQCARGCRFVLDRLVEHEGEHVIACVARARARACDDATFADCAARVPYQDGGPAPPLPPSASPFDDDEP